MDKMSSVIKKRNKEALPVSQRTTDDSKQQTLRRRLSSPVSSWVAFRRSMGGYEYAGSSVRKWWDWGWNWILSRKPTFAKEEETSVLGYNEKGSWGHVFYKVRSELRKLVGPSSDKVGLPQTYKSKD